VLYVITGPPASGKTSWVMERAKAHDIVIDFDLLAVALAGPGADSHDHPKTLRDVTFRTRSAAIQAAFLVADKTTVYLIHAQPNGGAMAQYRAAGAQIVTIDPGRSVVEQRCREQRPRGMLSVVGRWYRWHAEQSTERDQPAPAVEPVAQSTQDMPRSRVWRR